MGLFKRYRVDKVTDNFYAVKKRKFFKWETVNVFYCKLQAECEVMRLDKKKGNLFTHYCSINPKDKRRVVDTLCKMGYKPSSTFDMEQKYIFTTQNGIYYSTNNYHIEDMGKESRMIYDSIYGIYCCDNDDLFLAISAMNDRNDYMQWFYCEVFDCDGKQLPHHVFLCGHETLEMFGQVNNSPNTYKSGIHKKVGINGIIDYFLNKKE